MTVNFAALLSAFRTTGRFLCTFDKYPDQAIFHHNVLRNYLVCIQQCLAQICEFHPLVLSCWKAFHIKWGRALFISVLTQRQLKVKLEGNPAAWRRALQAQALWCLALFISSGVAQGQSLSQLMNSLLRTVCHS